MDKLHKKMVIFLITSLWVVGCNSFKSVNTSSNFNSQNLKIDNNTYAYHFIGEPSKIAELAQLNSTQLNRLLTIESEDRGNGNFKAILPTYIPDAFNLSNFNIREWKKGYDVSIKYSDPNGRCFKILIQLEGAGGSPTSYNTLEILSPALGKVLVELTDFNQQSEPHYITVEMVRGLLKSKYVYSFSSFSNPEQACKLLETKEFIKIVSSLHYLNP